jgi:pimeloyl-ACP methyl ester carboxylesterase
MRSWPSGLRGCHPPIPRVQQLYGVHARLVRFYDPENASRVPFEPGSKNAALYPVFVGDDVEFFIGGEVARLPDFRPRLGALRMPTLILAGRYDRALCPGTSSTSCVARLRPNSTGWSGAEPSPTSRRRTR